jgi:hypothetical protein
MCTLVWKSNKNRNEKVRGRLSVAKTPSGLKTLGFQDVSRNHLSHDAMTVCPAPSGRGWIEISSKSASRESGPASPTPGSDPKFPPATAEADGPSAAAYLQILAHFISHFT